MLTLPMIVKLPLAPTLNQVAQKLAVARGLSVDPIEIGTDPATIEQCWTELRTVPPMDRLALALAGPRVTAEGLEGDGWGANVSGLGLVLNALATYSNEQQVMLVFGADDTFRLRGNMAPSAVDCTSDECMLWKGEGLLAGSDSTCCFPSTTTPDAAALVASGQADRQLFKFAGTGDIRYYINAGGLKLFAGFYR